MISDPLEFNQSNYDENYQQLLSNYNKFNVIYVPKEGSEQSNSSSGLSDAEQPENYIQKTLQGYITTEGDSAFALQEQDSVYTFS